jgi:ATPase subunit of ABC transporter with duplicated ATPase domains
MFGLTGDKAFQDASTLSGGEKTRLSLAQLVAGRHNLLLLDEPTNNLDLASYEALRSALASYRGALLVVTHERRLLDDMQVDRVVDLGAQVADIVRPQ